MIDHHLLLLCDLYFQRIPDDNETLIKKIKQRKINSYSCLMYPIFVSAFISIVKNKNKHKVTLYAFVNCFHLQKQKAKCKAHKAQGDI